MEVYEFKKSYLTRLLETSNVLNSGDANVPASAIRSEWTNFIEVAIEPTGWQALWKASRPVCEQLSVKYPLVVLGTVNQVLFDELKAVFIIEAIQDDDVHLPEEQITVDLEELWPLRDQANPALNVNITADCIDKLRFFYQNLWMPWDNDTEDEHGWIDKHLESRIRLCFDLKNKTMSRRLSSHALALLAEARYIQRKREFLERELDEEDNDEDEEDTETSMLKDSRSSDLLQLNLRLNAIKNEIDILENPTMRSVFEKVRFGGVAVNNGCTTLSYIVTQAVTVDEQLTYLENAKQIMDQKMPVMMCDSLQHVLDHCSPDSIIYLPPGTRQDIKFLEYLNGGGSFKGVSSSSFLDDYETAVKTNPTIVSRNDDSVLLTIDGDFTVENVHLDCSNVRTGVVIKKGNITFRNCCFTGEPNTSTKQGIVIFGNCNITLEHCLIKEFSTGIYSNHDCTIRLINTNISRCITGLETLDECRILFQSASVTHCSQYGVLLEDFNDDVGSQDGSQDQASNRSKIYEDFNTVERAEFTFEGNCEFRENGKGNFVIRKGFSERFNNSCFVEENGNEEQGVNNPDINGFQEESIYDATNVSFCATFLEVSKLSSTKHMTPSPRTGIALNHTTHSIEEEESTNDTGVSGSLTHSEEDLSVDYKSNSMGNISDAKVFLQDPDNLSMNSEGSNDDFPDQVASHEDVPDQVGSDEDVPDQVESDEDVLDQVESDEDVPDQFKSNNDCPVQVIEIDDTIIEID